MPKSLLTSNEDVRRSPAHDTSTYRPIRMSRSWNAVTPLHAKQLFRERSSGNETLLIRDCDTLDNGHNDAQGLAGAH